MVTVAEVNKRVKALEKELEEEVSALKSKFEHFLLNYTNLESHYGEGFVAKFLKEK